MYEYLLEQERLSSPPSPPVADWAPSQVPELEASLRAVRKGLKAMEHVSALVAYVRAPILIEREPFISEWRRLMPDTVAPPAAGNLWLIYRKDEGLETAGHFPRARQWADGKLLSLSSSRKRSLQARFVAERGTFVRAIAERSLRALGWLHSRNVVHRTLGGRSLLAL